MPTWLSWLTENWHVIASVIAAIAALAPRDSAIYVLFEKLGWLKPKESRLAELISRSIPQPAILEEVSYPISLDEAKVFVLVIDAWGSDGKKELAERYLDTAVALRQKRLESEKE